MACAALSHPLLSVIVPVYNVERYLRRCLDSICNQSYPRLEIICVNDGSTDGSLGILREYEAKDNRLRVVDKPNGGLGSARNAGLDVANGDWVASVDSDDYLLPEAYASTMCYATDDVDLVCFGLRAEAEPGKEKEAENVQNWANCPWSGLRKLDAECLMRLRWNFVNKLFRRSVIEKHHLRFDESNFGSEDLCFHMRYVAYAAHAYFVPEQYYIYALRAGSIMHTHERMERWLESYLSAFSNILQVHHAVGMREEYAPFYTFLFQEIFNGVFRAASMTGRATLWHERLFALARAYGFARYEAYFASLAAQLQRRYRRYRLMTVLSRGERRKRYRENRDSCADMLQRIRQLLEENSVH